MKTVGEALLTRLKQLGVDYFFANPGTEFVSIIRGFEELPAESVPTPVLAPHEFQAVSMAYGYYLATKKPLAVMTHANVGAANALIGIIGAARMNIPLIFISGMTSQAESETHGHRDKLIHWSQDARDPGAMFREYAKAEIEVRDPSVIYDVIDRAYAIATSAPCGPVVIKVSRDILVAEKVPAVRPVGALAHASAHPEAKSLAKILEWLSTAKRPIFVTNRLGVDPQAVATLAQVSTRLGVGVLTPEDFYVSFPVDHVNHLGFRPTDALTDADLVIVLDTEAPWYPVAKGPGASARVVHVGSDPFFENIPLRSHRGDLFVQADPKLFLHELEGLAVAAPLLESRKAWIQSKRKPLAAMPTKFNAETVSAVIAEFIDEKTILINELSLVPERLSKLPPGHYFRSGSASPLGWGVGCALGLSLADRSKLVIAAVGDGVFYLSPMLGALQSAVALETPFITVILNNGSLGSIAKTSSEFYPEIKKASLTRFATEDVALEKSAEIVSGLGLRATSANELRRCLREAFKFCRKMKRPVVINAVF